MRRGALRALILAEARRAGVGGSFAVRRATRPSGQLQAPTELIEQVRSAIEGWALFVEIERVTTSGEVVIRVIKTPPDFS